MHSKHLNLHIRSCMNHTNASCILTAATAASQDNTQNILTKIAPSYIASIRRCCEIVVFACMYMYSHSKWALPSHACMYHIPRDDLDSYCMHACIHISDACSRWIWHFTNSPYMHHNVCVHFAAHVFFSFSVCPARPTMSKRFYHHNAFNTNNGRPTIKRRTKRTKQKKKQKGNTN